jgi:ribosomal RNA-processing protein 8
MFAVPGWSVDTSLLKTQISETQSKVKKGGAREDNGAVDLKSSKKRKRSGKGKLEVNSGNLADMWETVIEKRETIENKKPLAEKRQKILEDAQTTTTEPRTDELAHNPDEDQLEVRRKEKTKKDKKREKNARLAESQDNPIFATAEDQQPSTQAISMNTAPTKSTTTLTPLQAGMRAKLISARFRHLNQQLYTTLSADSLSLFKTNPEMFTEYHEGFRKQVEVWPENPVDGYITDIVLRGKIRGPSHKDKKHKKSKETPAEAENDTPALIPLPRTEGTCTVADLGCGDAALSAALQPQTKKLNLKIHSFDLQSPSRLVTQADIANLPLPDGSVDIAIFCLALMGINWVDFIEEVFRILRWKGELWIAEIKSRFGRVASAGKKGRVVEHSVGNRKKIGKEGLKMQKMIEEEVNDAVAAVEVDGHEDRGGETDVSAFVEVLRKRGFVLRGEGKEGDNGSKAVDLGNKMFVKMWFVKGATPIKGKGVPVPKGGEQHGLGETWKKKPKGRFIEEDVEQHVSSEAGVLKPCVYKLR